MTLKRKQKKTEDEVFFRLVEYLGDRQAAFVYYRGASDPTAITPPPTCVVLEASAATGERMTLYTVNDDKPERLDSERFAELRDLILHDGRTLTGAHDEADAALIGSLLEVRLGSETEAFSDCLHLIGALAVCESIVETASIRRQFAQFFRDASTADPVDPSWRSAMERMQSSAYDALIRDIARILND